MAWEHGIQKRRKTFPDINKEILEKEFENKLYK